MLALALSAELEGVTDLKPTDTTDAPYLYTFQVQCTSCRETHPNFVSVSRHEMNEQSGSRGEANFVWKCKNCKVCFPFVHKRESSATITGPPKSYEQQSPAKWKTIIEIDCRGLEFTDFRPDGDWEAVGAESGTKFNEIDLRDKDFYDYDEKTGEEVSIKDIKWDIRRA